MTPRARSTTSLTLRHEKSRFKRRVLHLPPLVLILLGEWALVAAAYALNWSGHFQLPFTTILGVAGAVVGGTFLGYYVAAMGLRVSNRRTSAQMVETLSQSRSHSGWSNNAWSLWLGLAALEIAIVGQVPLMNGLFDGISNYREFGIPSVHGLLLALGCALALVDQCIRLSSGKNPIGPRTIVVIAWLVLILGRKQMVIILIQLALLLVVSGRVRASASQLVRTAVLAGVFIYAFGFLGAVRTGGISITEKLRFTGPDWMPDAAVWLYAYATTPVANLANAVSLRLGGDFGTPANTFGGLLPAFITGDGNEYDASQAWLLTSNFNVSTGYIDPFLDGGVLYIIGYSIMIGFIVGALRLRASSAASILAYVAAYQCALSMMYANNFSNLNNVSQILILLVLGRTFFTEQWAILPSGSEDKLRVRQEG